MPRPLTRIPPALPAGAMKTYRVLAPSETHWRPATCAEVDCWRHRDGWWVTLNEATQDGQRWAYYIRHDRTRRHIEHPNLVPGRTVFNLQPGSPCYERHRVPLDRLASFQVVGGDWRGNPTGTPVRVHARPEDWVEDFAEHQQRLAERIKRG